MFSLRHSFLTADTQICSKRKRRDFEIPVTFADDKEIWINRLIELAVDAYEKKVRIEFYLEIYTTEDIPGLTAERMHKIERSYLTAVDHFVACYIDFDERFIDDSQPIKAISSRAHELFSDWCKLPTAREFEQSALTYFQDLEPANSASAISFSR